MANDAVDFSYSFTTDYSVVQHQLSCDTRLFQSINNSTGATAVDSKGAAFDSTDFTEVWRIIIIAEPDYKLF